LIIGGEDMKSICTVILVASVIALGQKPKPNSTHNADVMVVAIARDTNVYAGGTTFGEVMKNGEVSVDPVAWLTPAGNWKKIDCDSDHPGACTQFDHEYLKKAHTYSVVSADGRGAIVHVRKMSLTPPDDPDSCFGYGGDGTYSGAPIAYVAVAAESSGPFIAGPSAKRLSEKEAEPIWEAFKATATEKLQSAAEYRPLAGVVDSDPTFELRFYSVHLGGREYFVVQRASQEGTDEPENGNNKHNYGMDTLLAVGRMDRGHFDLLCYQRTDDEDERFLGMIHLKNGKDYIVDTVSDPESQFFRIYGIRNGTVALVFEGGGGGC
jgi:hypothetical protein